MGWKWVKKNLQKAFSGNSLLTGGAAALWDDKQWDKSAKMGTNVMMGDLAGWLNNAFGGSDSSALSDISKWWNAPLFDKTAEGMMRGHWNFGDEFRTDAQETFSGRDTYDHWVDSEKIDVFNTAVLPVIGGIVGDYYFGPVGAGVGAGGGRWFSDFLAERDTDWGDVGKTAVVAAAMSYLGDALSGVDWGGGAEAAEAAEAAGSAGSGAGGGAGGAGESFDIINNVDYAIDTPTAPPSFNLNDPNYAIDLPSAPVSEPVYPAADPGWQQLLDSISTNDWVNLASAAATPFLYQGPQVLLPPPTPGQAQGLSSVGRRVPFTTGLDDAFKEQRLTRKPQDTAFGLGALASLLSESPSENFPEFNELY